MCDSFVVLPSATEDGSTILGKNSDREPNEAQLLTWIPPADHSEKTVSCTYIPISQVKETRGVLLSRPFWLWGAEMGVNDAGVAIGNEAVFTREPQTKEKKLLGMDLLRLALERATTAEQALEIIIALLHDYGQGGPCGFEDTLYYHNSFLIADKKAAWVLETAGDFWAAKRIKETYAISNGLTIGGEFDRSHPGLIDHAREKGWLKPGKDFHFAACYSDWFYTTFSGSRQRRRCSLRNMKTPFSVSRAVSALRDHGDDHYTPSNHVFMDKVCAHAAYPVTRHAAQSTGSLVARLSDEPMAWITGTSAPCTSLYKPVWLGKPFLPDSAGVGEGVFSKESLWWQHERLHRVLLQDYAKRMEQIIEKRDTLQKNWMNEAEKCTSPGKQRQLTEKAFSEASKQEMEWLRTILPLSLRSRPNRLYRVYWKKQNQKAGMP